MALAHREPATHSALSLRDAIRTVATQNPELVRTYHAAFDAGARDRTASAVVSMSDRAAQAERDQAVEVASRRLLDVANQIQQSEGVRFDDALCRASQRDPAAAEAYLRGRNGRA
jgi:hypothetical protein